MRRARISTAATVTALALILPAAAGWASTTPSEVPDPTYQTNGRVLDIVYSPDATVVYLVGSFTEVRPPANTAGQSVVRNRAAAFDVATGQVLPWNPNVDGPVDAVDLVGSTVFLGGRFSSVGGTARKNMAAVDASSGAVRSWKANVGARVRDIEISPDGVWAYVGGAFTTVNGQARRHVAKLDVGSAALSSWRVEVVQESGTCPPRCFENVVSLELSTDGATVYIGGSFAYVNGVPRNSAAAVSASTGTLLDWNPNVYAPRSRNLVYDLELLGSKVFVCGDYWAVGGTASPNLAAVHAVSGARDTAFKATTDGGVPDCDVSPGRVFFGGHFGKAGSTNAYESGEERIHIAAADATTGALDPWDPGANSSAGVFAVAVHSDALVAIGGDFTKIGPYTYDQQGFAQFSDGSSTTSTSDPTAAFTSSCSGLSCRFDGSGSTDADGTISSYHWDFGDGTTGTGAVVDHTYAAPDTYTVTLTVTDDDGGTGTTSSTVVVEAPTQAPTVSAVSPATIGVGTHLLTISGSGFVDGATVTIEGGRGPAPTVDGVTYVSASELRATVTVAKGGPTDVWDVRVTVPDGSSGVAVDVLTVQR